MKGGQRCPSVVALPCGYMSFPLFSEVWYLFSTPEDAFRIQATLIHVLSFWGQAHKSQITIPPDCSCWESNKPPTSSTRRRQLTVVGDTDQDCQS